MKFSAQTGIENILAQNGIINDEQLSLVKLENLTTGKPTEKILLEHAFVTNDQLINVKAEILKIPTVAIANKGISPDILNSIPEPVARRYVLIPFDKQENVLFVAMADPLDLQVTEFVKKKSGCDIKPFLASSEDILSAINDQYAQGLSNEVMAAVKEATIVAGGTEQGGKTTGGVEIIREAPVSKIVSTILEYAIKARASDIHLEPAEEKTRIRYRIDGILYEKLVLPRKVHEAVASRIKILSDLKIDERRIPQDGRFNFKFEDKEVDLRVSTLPTVYGEKIVMRLLPKAKTVPTLQDLGLRGTALKNLEMAMLRPHGIIIVCGPTGSGKTTTLYSVLAKINTVRINILTLEDPVEYEMPGINQVQINPTAGLTFASGLRAFLRQDPNVILVGEIRDRETTQLAIQAALTGHLVFSTLHTTNASGSLPRLLDMGAEPFLLASSMNAIVGQRICRRICPSCQETFEP
ncbi:MAG: ATPase, T2SS/T4P/T4SS family, partial [bacterium]|nr:ATPase, T2SS/T4P/T4SS family [bacterium]